MDSRLRGNDGVGVLRVIFGGMAGAVVAEGIIRGEATLRFVAVALAA